MTDPYEILQVARHADAEVIHAAYRKLAQKHHPDRSKDPDATRRMIELTEAHDILSDPDRRVAFDRANPGPGVRGSRTGRPRTRGATESSDAARQDIEQARREANEATLRAQRAEAESARLAKDAERAVRAASEADARARAAALRAEEAELRSYEVDATRKQAEARNARRTEHPIGNQENSSRVPDGDWIYFRDEAGGISRANSATGRTQVVLSSAPFGDAPLALQRLGLEVMDRRQSGGALWVVGGEECRPVVEALGRVGVHFVFAKAGGRASGRRPAWFTNWRGP
jgi:curved DNA-binding protein CbpA